MENIEDKVKDRIINVADSGIEAIENYFKGEEIDPEKVSIAFKLINQATKVMHMNQVRKLTERSQALRLLPWLRNDKARDEYIRLTNPEVTPLLLGRPKSRK